jgi:hypothetical protein
MSSFFRVSTSDARFRDRDKATLKTLSASAPPEYAQKVDMRRVYRPIIEGWVASRIPELLGIEDEVVVGLVNSKLAEEASGDTLDTATPQQ